jgi:hypothetical protein
MILTLSQLVILSSIPIVRLGSLYINIWVRSTRSPC